MGFSLTISWWSAMAMFTRPRVQFFPLRASFSTGGWRSRKLARGSQSDLGVVSSQGTSSRHRLFQQRIMPGSGAGSTYGSLDSAQLGVAHEFFGNGRQRLSLVGSLVGRILSSLPASLGIFCGIGENTGRPMSSSPNQAMLGASTKPITQQNSCAGGICDGFLKSGH